MRTCTSVRGQAVKLSTTGKTSGQRANNNLEVLSETVNSEHAHFQILAQGFHVSNQGFGVVLVVVWSCASLGLGLIYMLHNTLC